MGQMGRAFAGRALGRGHRVAVWNRSPGRVPELVEAGATEAPSPADAARQADVVLVVVADDAAVEEVCLGGGSSGGGALAALRAGAVLANVSTVSPGTVRRLADAGPPDAVLDTPVMGGPAAIGRGEGRLLVGGPVATMDRLQPLWSDLSAGQVHCGPVGSASVVKILSNLQLVVGVGVLAEAVATAREHGVDDDLLRSVFSDSAVVSTASRARLDSILAPEHPGWFPPALARKDLRLAIALAREGRVGARLGAAAEALLTTVIDSGDEWPDFSAIVEALGPGPALPGPAPPGPAPQGSAPQGPAPPGPVPAGSPGPDPS